MKPLWQISFALVLLAGLCQAANAATLSVENKLDEAVTVNVDGNYGCNTAPATTCSIPVSAGDHTLKASTASGKTFHKDASVPASGYTWTIS